MRSNFNEKGEFKYGNLNYEKARETAENRAKFKLDNDEEEMNGDEIGCCDCAFGRWSAESFICAVCGEIGAKFSFGIVRKHSRRNRFKRRFRRVFLLLKKAKFEPVGGDFIR